MQGSRFLLLLARLLGISALAFLPVQLAQAQAGALDLTFNETGIWTGLAPDVLEARAQDSIVLPDGKIMVVGEIFTSSFVLDALVQRHLPDGTLDASFGTQGRLILPETTSERIFHAVTLQPDGKILAVGWMRTDQGHYSYKVDILALRLMPDGTRDSSFGNNGLAMTAAPGESAYIYDAEVQPDGKILVAGKGPGFNVGVYRLNVDGTLDTTFADQGGALSEYGTFSDLQDMVLLPDGRIVLAGYMFEDSKMSGLMVCLNADGTPDTRFSDDGVVKIFFPNSTEVALVGVQALPDGRLLASGYVVINDRLQLMLACYRADRTLDEAFGEGGIAMPVFSSRRDMLGEAAVTENGQILVSSSSYAEGDTERSSMALARLNANGTVDTGFGENGQIVLDIPGGSGSFALCQASASQWLASGFAYGEERAMVALARFLTGPATVMVKDEDDSPLENGARVTFKPVAADFTSQRSLAVVNPGGDDLPDVRIAIEGTDFEFDPAPASLQVPQGSTPYVLRFSPTGAPGQRTALLKVTLEPSGTVLSEIQLQGRVFSPAEDSDGDGLNDVTEFKLEALGFDPLTAQAEKVNLLFGSLGEAQVNLNAAGYYTPGQVAELHAGTLIEKDSDSGELVLRLSLEQSSSLTNFEPFPLVQSGVTITPQGRLEFRFTPPAGRSFYRFVKP